MQKFFAMPSLYEGFGLPVLEAMAQGTPVLTSKISSLPEVAGDAALLVDPYDTKSIAEGLKTILGDRILRSELVKRGYERIKAFSWESASNETVQVFEEILIHQKGHDKDGKRSVNRSTRI